MWSASRSIAPRQRGARIETADVRRLLAHVPASLPGNGERGLKRRQSGVVRHGPDASLPGNGERGLKREGRLDVDDIFLRASLPGNGERGLKLLLGRLVGLDQAGIAPRQRGARIETVMAVDSEASQ